MNNTYKLDKEGIPYRVASINKKAEPEDCGGPVLVPHDGALWGFHLYDLSL